MVLIRNQFHPGPVLHRHAAPEPKVDDGARLPLGELAPEQLAARVRAACDNAEITVSAFENRGGLTKGMVLVLERGSKPRPGNRVKIEGALLRLEGRAG